jgi:acyl carrier protein
MMGVRSSTWRNGKGTMEGILDRLQYLVGENLDLTVKPEEIDPDAQLIDGGLMLDSLSIVKLISLSEQEFKIEFGEDDLRIESFASLRALAGVIALHCNGQHSVPHPPGA